MKNIIFLILFSNALSVYAGANESLNFSYITKNEGLSDNNVECIFKDSDGFMWFGTRNGLCRFDGYEIKVYRKNENENSISGNRILDIIEDKNGYLWIGTYKDGLNRFNKQTEKFEHYGLQQGIGQRINRIKLFSDSSIWVGSNIGVIRLVNWGDTVRIIPFNDDSNYLSTYDMLETRNREVYIATDNQVIQKLNKNTLKFETIEYKRIPELSSNYRKRIIEDKNGLIWITASYHGLCSYDPKTGVSEIFTAENNNLSTNVLMGSMDIDGDGNIWLCTEEDGINIFNTESKTFKHLKNNPEQQGSLNSNHTYSVYFDDNERVWIGTFDKGINVYNPYQKKFSSSLFEPDDLTILSGSSVLDIFEDSKNRVWVGTDGFGLFCFEKANAPLHYKKADESDVLTSNVVTALGEDPLGNILIGTYTGGLIAFNKESEKITKYYSDFDRKQLSSPHVWEIFTDSKKRIWLGLLAFGVDLFDYRDGSFIN
jgi:ligand-binding sensor domain-containing protein